MRTLHITYVPDEEVGGGKGMGVYVNSEDLKMSNVGLILDEGPASANDDFLISYGEKAPWQFKVIANGRPSHGSYMLEDNASVKLGKVIARLLAFREQQLQKLKDNPSLEPGDVTSINLSQLGGGVQQNVVSSEYWAVFDMRIKIEKDFTFDDVDKFLQNILKEAGPGVRCEFILKSKLFGETHIDDRNIWWTTLQGLFNEMGHKLATRYLSGATDARFLRNANYTAFGFSPLRLTETLAHEDNEYMNENTYIEGIEILEKIIPGITSVDPSFG